jgi:hypothetical protein
VRACGGRRLHHPRATGLQGAICCHPPRQAPAPRQRAHAALHSPPRKQGARRRASQNSMRGAGRGKTSLFYYAHCCSWRRRAGSSAAVYHLSLEAWSKTYAATAWICSSDSVSSHAGMPFFPLVTCVCATKRHAHARCVRPSAAAKPCLVDNRGLGKAVPCGRLQILVDSLLAQRL